ncbi:Uncharacterized protein Rs2_29257 [Raphanus sativus]|nr:Uncharacterized protein Rs2_29257 [Raphanus sativus]
MAFNKDLKLKAPMVEDYGSSLQEAFNKGKEASTEHYRAKLFSFKQLHDALIKKHAEEHEVSRTEARHDEEREVYRVLGKLELLKELFNMAAMTKEKKKLETELVLAKEKMDGVKISYVDWFRLGESQMFD